MSIFGKSSGSFPVRGPAGPPGADGKGILHGPYAPGLSDGRVGEFFLDSLNNRLWGPKEEGGWVAWVSLAGTPGSQGEQGEQGEPGTDGVDGNNGWAPILAVVMDGSRSVLRVQSWTGGEGTPPASGSYLAASGFVATAAEALNIRGASGAGTGDMLAANNLSDLASAAAARTNLNVYSKTEVDDAIDFDVTAALTEIEAYVTGA